MRRTLSLLLAMSIMLCSAGCIIQSRQDAVLDSLGKCEKKQFWTHGEFQDYTDFGIYTCQSTGIENSDYFSKVSQEKALGGRLPRRFAPRNDGEDGWGKENQACQWQAWLLW